MSPDTPQSLRLFYALWPDQATRDALARLQTIVAGRKTKYEHLHLTLAFLGQQSTDLLPALEEILKRLPREEMILTLDRLRYFAKNRIAWVGMHAVPEQLLDLQHQLMSDLTQHGITADRTGRFKPHVTLARDAPPPEDLTFEPIRWPADTVCLVASVNGPTGTQYRVLASNRQ